VIVQAIGKTTREAAALNEGDCTLTCSALARRGHIETSALSCNGAASALRNRAAGGAFKEAGNQVIAMRRADQGP
jgi:hypothetical protein